MAQVTRRRQASYAIPIVQDLIKSGTPIFGICLGHQILALAVGAKTVKMPQGHHGANHPVKDFETGKVEIVSMNHGFAVDGDTLPAGIIETHKSLFDGSNCGLRLERQTRLLRPAPPRSQPPAPKIASICSRGSRRRSKQGPYYYAAKPQYCQNSWCLFRRD